MNKKITACKAGVLWMLAGGLLTVGIGRQIPVWTGAADTGIPDSPVRSAAALPAEPETTEDQEDESELLPNVLNLVYEFPEGADTSDVLNSQMGMIYRELEIMDQNWLEDIYNLSGMTPEQMAGRLGRPADSIMGNYNKKDENQLPDDPSTWKIGSWSRINLSVLNGDGEAADRTSNVKEILSMANVYTFYHDYRDTELFLEYATELWNLSHSYDISMSGVYYCDGCMDLSEEEEMTQDIAEILAEESKETGDAASQPSSVNPDSRSETADTQSAGAQTAGFQAEESQADEPQESDSQTADPGSISSGSSAGAAASGPGVQMHSAIEESIARLDGQTPDALQLAEIQETSEGSADQSQNVSAYQETPAAVATPSELQGPGDYVQMLVNAAQAAADQEASAADLQPETEAAAVQNPVCPGHIDLNITVHITGTEEGSSLYGLDSRGNTASGAWPGWTAETISLAEDLAHQDWYENYGLSISDISLQTPMSEEEIADYMDDLPQNLSQERRELIRFALESVGRVPYYWGGKASAPGYSGNSFGSLVSSDYKGRIRKGLDCSGWIAWVYWSVTGERLPAEGTSGLIQCGTAVSRSQLQPGDIIVRTGTNAHVVMFLGWGSNGKLLCIHESSGPANNVTISELDANWKYYRKLIE